MNSKFLASSQYSETDRNTPKYSEIIDSTVNVLDTSPIDDGVNTPWYYSNRNTPW